MNITEARAKWQAQRGRFERAGVYLPDVRAFLPSEFKDDVQLAYDALPELGFDAVPALGTTDPNSSIPALLTTMIDPQVFHVLFTPNNAVKILGEVRKGTWVDDVAMFPVAESTGEVSSYGDYAESGRAGVNTNWPQRQSYPFQVIKQYGDRELARAGLARINWVSELDIAAALSMNKFLNHTYFFGVNQLQNYGLINDPHLSASISPAPKANGGVTWLTSSGAPNATANEVYNDILTLFQKLVTQSGGLITMDSPLVLALGPNVVSALNFANSFNVNTRKLLTDNFKNLRIETAVQYNSVSTINIEGSAAGNVVQMICEEVEGQRTGYCAYNEKMRAFPIIRLMSAYKQKVMGGTWGSVLRQTFTIGTMVGV
jgi:hypothetical protein